MAVPDRDLRYAVVLSSHREYGYESGTRIEIAVPAGAEGAEFVQRCFAELESAVNAARCYRGKVLSLDARRRLSADARGASWSTNCRRSSARTSSCPKRR